jgi:hypothetical protein
MDNLIEYGWVESEFNTIYKRKFQRIALLMRAYKSQEIEKFQYVLIDKYFIDSENNLYFLGNSQVYSIDLNDDFCYKSDLESLENDYKKIKFICEYTIDNIFKYELVFNKYKREKRINEILDQF